jgi:dehydrogenase/reductase SDR family member 1
MTDRPSNRPTAPPPANHRPLAGCVAIVTGASRGVGKGVALGLGEAGATVYVTGRTVTPGALPGTVGQTADEVTALGGKGVAVVCDHANDDEVRALFDRVFADEGKLDVLVNNAFGIPDGRVIGPFWELPISQWDTIHRVGLRSHFVAGVLAAPKMIAAGRGLIVNVSSFGARHYAISVAYGVGKAGVDRMTRDMARELKPHGVCVVSLWPGVVKTERLLVEAARLGYDPNEGESPQLSGRAVAAVAADPDRMAKSGSSLVVAELAREYGFTDLDGNLPAIPFAKKAPAPLPPAAHPLARRALGRCVLGRPP